MDTSKLILATLVAAPPGAGIGLALWSVTRGEAIIEAAGIGIGAAVGLTAVVYLIATMGSVDEDVPRPTEK